MSSESKSKLHRRTVLKLAGLAAGASMLPRAALPVWHSWFRHILLQAHW